MYKICYHKKFPIFLQGQMIEESVFNENPFQSCFSLCFVVSRCGNILTIWFSPLKKKIGWISYFLSLSPFFQLFLISFWEEKRYIDKKFILFFPAEENLICNFPNFLTSFSIFIGPMKSDVIWGTSSFFLINLRAWLENIFQLRVALPVWFEAKVSRQNKNIFVWRNKIKPYNCWKQFYSDFKKITQLL